MLAQSSVRRGAHVCSTRTTFGHVISKWRLSGTGSIVHFGQGGGGTTSSPPSWGRKVKGMPKMTMAMTSVLPEPVAILE